MPIEAQNYTEILSHDDVLILKINKSIKNIIKREGYVTSNVTIKIFEPDGGNYLATLCEVDIEGFAGKERKKTNIFMKIIVPEEKITWFSLKDVYKKELFCYNDFSRIVNEIQNDFNLPQENRFIFVKNYFDASNSEVVMLENMKKNGFATIGRMDLITVEFADLAIKELAKFHALSFVLEAWKPNFFYDKVKTLCQPFNFNKEYESILNNLSQISIEHLDGERKRRLEEYVPTTFKKYETYLKDSSGTKCCLCHGDYRPNNVLFKKIDGKISKVIPIDYQLVYYGCPVMDFLYFIIPCTDQKFRKAHLKSLKDLYYETMRSYLKYFQLDIETIYPRTDFESLYKERLDYGLFMSLFVMPLIMSEGNGISDFDMDSIDTLKGNINYKLKERLEGLIDDYIEWGFL